MKEKYICPHCNQKEVEEINACGASNYFCQYCKKLLSKTSVKAVNEEAKKDN